MEVLRLVVVCAVRVVEVGAGQLNPKLRGRMAPNDRRGAKVGLNGPCGVLCNTYTSGLQMYSIFRNPLMSHNSCRRNHHVGEEDIHQSSGAVFQKHSGGLVRVLGSNEELFQIQWNGEVVLHLAVKTGCEAGAEISSWPYTLSWRRFWVNL